MFKIGDFSKLSRVPVKTLRYYDQIGLFKPHGIDRFTRYRYYSADQLALLYRILGLKELGFSLEQIAQLLAGDLSPVQLKKMLELRRQEIVQQLQDSQEQLARVEERLRQIEQVGQFPEYDVILKSIQAQWVAALSESLPDYDTAGQVFTRLFDELCGILRKVGIETGEPGLAIYTETDLLEDRTQVEAALPLPGPLPAHLPIPQGVSIYQLPEVETAACVLHQGEMSSIGEAYQFLLSWIQANGYRIHGPVREQYLRHKPDSINGQCVIEIQFPVHPIRKEKSAMEEIRIVNLEKFYVVGMAYLGKNENNEISRMWDRFIPRIQEIHHLADGPEVSYGVCAEEKGSGLIDYVAGLPVKQLADIPHGMVGREVPAQTYVVMPAHGLEDIGPTYNRILKEWMPTSGYQPAEGPDFEYYPEDFNPNDPESIVDIYFPIKKA